MLKLTSIIKWRYGQIIDAPFMCSSNKMLETYPLNVNSK